MNPAQFIETYQDAITEAVLRTYPPLYTARNRNDWGFDLRRLRRRPMGAQGDAIRAVAVSLQRHRGTNLVGEMGTGKTTIGAAAAYLAGFSSVLVLCPPHLVRKWAREVAATVPFARAAIVTSISDLDRLSGAGDAPIFVILSRERAKLSYRWLPSVVDRLAISGGSVLRDDDGEALRLPVQVVYFAYSGTLQSQALALVAKKLQSSLAVEGELVEEGLAAHGDEGEDLLLSLARSLTERVEASEDSLEGLFAGVRQTEQDVESALRPEDLATEEFESGPMPVPWTMPEREDGDLTEFVDLPLFTSTATATPSGNGASPEEPAHEGEPSPVAQPAAIPGGQRDDGVEDTPPANGHQLRLL